MYIEMVKESEEIMKPLNFILQVLNCMDLVCCEISITNKQEKNLPFKDIGFINDNHDTEHFQPTSEYIVGLFCSPCLTLAPSPNMFVFKFLYITCF